MGKFDARALREHFLESLRANFPIVLLASVISTVGIIFYFIETFGVPLTSILGLTPSTPWGIFTLMFVHDGWNHLSNNVMTIWAWTGLALLLDSMHSQADRRRRAVFFVAVVLTSAIMAHSLWFAMVLISGAEMQNPSVGASGVTFAFGGAVLGLALMNGRDAISKRQVSDQRKKANFVMMINFLVAAMIAVLVLSDPAAFIAKGQANHFGHGVSFIFGLFGILLKENFVPMMKGVIARWQQ